MAWRMSGAMTLFTALPHSALFGEAENSENTNAMRANFGFEMFPYSGHNVYGGRSIRDVPAMTGCWSPCHTSPVMIGKPCLTCLVSTPPR